MSRFTFENEKLREVRFPLGGIGAGCVSLDGSARFVDWQIKNRPHMESYGGFSHIAVKAEQDGALLGARALHGPLQPSYMGKGLHPFGGYSYGPARETMVGVPHFDDVTMTAKFPVAEYAFKGDFPANVSLRALSPFEPMNDFDSSLPTGMMEVSLTNTTSRAIDYSVAFTLYNPDEEKALNRIIAKEGITTLLCSTARTEYSSPAWGQTAVATDGKDVSSQSYWYRGSWFDGLNMFWQEFTSLGKLKARDLEPTTKYNENGTICVHLKAEAGQTVKARFALSWYFPNYEKYWGNVNPEVKPVWRNWYATQFTGADHVAGYVLTNWDRLSDKTQQFVDALFDSSLPEEVIDAAGSTLAVLKSPTCLRLTDGSFYAWEGSHARDGSCEGSCQHVWNYQYALPYLFPALERSMRKLDYDYNLQADGSLRFRLQLPLGTPAWNFRACVDGQMGGLIKTYREWKLCGDNAWLKDLWPGVKRSMEFAWSPDNYDAWDPNKSGVMTGRQHHTLDMELFGPNAWLTGMYLAALEAAARMATAMGEDAFAKECLAIKEKGKAWMDEHLFNGEYYFHEIDLGDKSILERFAKGGDSLFNQDIMQAYWNDENKQIKYQIGEGCSIDQLLGQWHADLNGLGELFDAKKTRLALEAIYRYNFVEKMGDTFNPCRIYCLQDESGLVICGYPKDKERPVISAPYAEETMHGFEYAAACHMIMHGMEEEGLRCVRAVRDRYDGERRNPYNEIECGGFYARSMAAWALINTYLGLQVDMTRGEIGIAPLHADKPFQSIWSASGAWGNVTMEAGALALSVAGGSITLSSFELPTMKSISSIRVGEQEIVFTRSGQRVVFAKPLSLAQGQSVQVS